MKIIHGKGIDTMTTMTKQAALGLALTLLVPAGLRAQGDVYRIGGSEVAVYNLAGSVQVTRGSGSEVVVEVLRGGRDADRLDVRTGEVGGRQTLRVIYPGDRVVYRPSGRGSYNTSLRVRDDGTFGEGGGRRVEVSGSGSGLEAHADLVIRVPAGRTFSVHLAVGEAELRGVEGRFLVDTGSGAVDARDVRGALRVDTGSGPVRAAAIEGVLEVDTGSGSVTLEDVRGDRVLVDTGSGSVRGSGVRAGTLRVDTGSGGIDLGAVASSDIVLDTGSGSVTLELLQDVERLDVDTGSGSVTLRVPDDVGAEILVETGSGGIDVQLPVQVRRAERDRMEGTLGDGRGRIRVDTGSGGIRLLRR